MNAQTAGRGGDQLLSPRVGRWVLLATAVLQCTAPAVAGFDQSSANDPAIVPPGPFFAVWGVVLLGCLVIAVRGLPLRKADSPGYRRLHVPLGLAQMGFVIWLCAAATAPVATVPVFAGMLLALGWALRRAPQATTSSRAIGSRREPTAAGPTTGGVTTGGVTSGAVAEVVLGVYAGWSAAAVWINTATVLDRPSETTLAVLLLGAAVTVVLVATVVARTVPARAGAGAAGAWALGGVALSTFVAGGGELFSIALAGCVLVTGAAILSTARAHRRTGQRRP